MGQEKPIVTLENALSYIEAINNAVRRDVMNIDKSDRGFVIGIVSAALARTSESLQQFRAKMEKNGLSEPVTDEQKIRLRAVLQGANGVS